MMLKPETILDVEWNEKLSAFSMVGEPSRSKA